MKSLYYLNKYLIKYKWYLILGILFIISSNLFAVYMPEIVDRAADKISNHFIDKKNGASFNKEKIWNAGIYLCLIYLALALLKGIFLRNLPSKNVYNLTYNLMSTPLLFPIKL